MDNKQENSASKNVNAVLFVIVLTSFIPAIAGSILNVAIPAIGIEFHSSAGSLAWIVNAFTIGVLALLLPLGRIADLTSKRKILIAGLITFAVPNAIGALATSLEMLIVLRIVQSFGAAAMFATSQAILVDTVPAEKRGRALGMSVAGVYAGLSIGPVVGGLITEYFGWRWIFVFAALLGIVTVVVAILKLPKKILPPREGRLMPKLDVPGMLMYGIGAICMTYGFNVITNGMLPIFITVIGVALLVLFVIHENRTTAPLIDMALFKNGNSFLFSNLAALLNYAATFAMSYLLAIYLQIVLGYSSDISGFILICSPIVQTVVSLIGGRLSDKYSPYILSSIGMALCATGTIDFLFVGATRASLPLILVNLAIVGVGFGFFSSPNTNAIMSLSPPKDRAIVSSLIGTMRNFGMAFSMCIISIVMKFYLGTTPIEMSDTALIAKSSHTAFIIFSVLCALGIFFSLGRKKQKA